MKELGLLLIEFATDVWQIIASPIFLVSLIEMVFIILAAYKNAIMDLIQPLDLLKSKGIAWSKEAMEANKDTNNDGKVSWLEGSFPPDKWHEAKRDMIGFFGVSHACSFLTCYLLHIQHASLYLLLAICIVKYAFVFIVFGVAFELIYSTLRSKYQKK